MSRIWVVSPCTTTKTREMRRIVKGGRLRLYRKVGVKCTGKGPLRKELGVRSKESPNSHGTLKGKCHE